MQGGSLPAPRQICPVKTRLRRGPPIPLSQSTCPQITQQQVYPLPGFSSAPRTSGSAGAAAHPVPCSWRSGTWSPAPLGSSLWGAPARGVGAASWQPLSPAAGARTPDGQVLAGPRATCCWPPGLCHLPVWGKTNVTGRCKADKDQRIHIFSSKPAAPETVFTALVPVSRGLHPGEGLTGKRNPLGSDGKPRRSDCHSGQSSS